MEYTGQFSTLNGSSGNVLSNNRPIDGHTDNQTTTGTRKIIVYRVG